MKTALGSRALAACAALWWLAAAATASAQDPLAAAREFYASARYEEALGVLDWLRAGEPVDPGAADEASLQLRALDIEKHRALCLFALGREGEADAAMSEVVSIDPFYQPDTGEFAPSVRAFFSGVRRRVLPEVAPALYADARAAYERGDFARALDGFRRVIAILDEPDMAGRLADLRVLADGFARLSAAAVPEPVSATATAPSGEPTNQQSAISNQQSAPPAYGPDSPGVTPPVVVRQVLPPVTAGLQAIGRTRGEYEITIDEAGRVIAIAVRSSLTAAYDRAFIEAASAWRYRPALLDGRPVQYRKQIQISVAR